MATKTPWAAWREQIINNLSLVSNGNSIIDIYTSLDTQGSWTIYAVETHKGNRNKILSETGSDLEVVWEALHKRSAQEVCNFIQCNGFAFTRRGILSDFSVSSGSESERVPSKPRKSTKSSTCEENEAVSSSEDSSPEKNVPQSRSVVLHPRPPPPGWSGAPSGVKPRPPFQNRALPLATKPRLQPRLVTAQKLVRLVISWEGHGEKKMVVCCQVNRHAVQSASLAYVRKNWQLFENVEAQHVTSDCLEKLSANLKSIDFGDGMCDIFGNADDFSTSFRPTETPKFGIKIE